ncbi:MAG TPA: hypothetical protein VM261_03700 [Kofleriaceae bacterium]|nr:hypothetical protein [Kofleriaceae bacterium]
MSWEPRVLFAISIIAAAAACGPSGGATTPGTKPVVAGTKQVAPLQIEADSKSPAQALILGTDAKGGSTVLPLSGAENRVSVDSMWVRMGSGPAVGGSSPVALVTSPNPEGVVRVGIYEEVAGSLGPQWRAGVWLASFVSSTVLNKDLTDFKFTAEAGGHVDGASASGLMTAGYLASMIGAKVDPSVTMTGIINPDGTIGPVGGIPQKFIGSIEKGKKRLGYPIGMRYAEDANSGERVDLVQLAKERGAEAVEVADVYAAVELLTGKKLPRPVPVDEAQMALEDGVTKALDEKYDAWFKLVSDEWARLIELDNAGRLPQGLVQLAAIAQAEGKAADKLKAQGLSASAYHRIVRAWVYAAGATATSDILELTQAGDLIGARAKLHEFQGLAVTTEASLRTIAEMKPATMGAHLQMLSAFQIAIGGWGFHTFSGEFLAAQTLAMFTELEKLPKAALVDRAVGDTVVAGTAPTVLAIARAVANSAMALEAMDIEGQKSINYLCSLPNVRRLATSFSSAAGSNLAYFDSLIVAEVAKAFNLPPDQAKVKFAGFEPDYLVALMAGSVGGMGGLPDQLKKEWGEDSISWGLFTLAASELSFFRTSMLISKWYSLGVQNDPITGRPTSVQHEKAFFNMLAFAEQRARENARAALVATGEIPVQARLRYQQARVLREGDLADKLAALEGFWAASVYAQTAVMLARNPI